VPNDYSLVATGLRKRYKRVHALNGFDLRVAAGTIHGLLGPNGAGKSTAIKVLATLMSFDSGQARISGHDVASEANLVRRKIGLVGQSAAVDEILGGRQNLVMFARLYGMSTKAAKVRADELLERFSLTEAANRPVAKYSGGMRRRLDVAASLLLRPAVLFLDEPTTGLDPRGRNEVWATIRDVKAAGTTVLLTTQYLDEADKLADHISVMNHGKIIAQGTPDQLKRDTAGDLLVVRVAERARLGDAAAILERITGSTPTLSEEVGTATVPAEGSSTLLDAVRALDAAAIELDDVSLRRPTLDEVFLTLTGGLDVSSSDTVVLS
jgi:ABC-2 type transport system ATP-binding protein